MSIECSNTYNQESPAIPETQPIDIGEHVNITIADDDDLNDENDQKRRRVFDATNRERSVSDLGFSSMGRYSSFGSPAGTVQERGHRSVSQRSSSSSGNSGSQSNKTQTEKIVSVESCRYRPSAADDWNQDDAMKLLARGRFSHTSEIVNSRRGYSYIDSQSVDSENDLLLPHNYISFHGTSPCIL